MNSDNGWLALIGVFLLTMGVSQVVISTAPDLSSFVGGTMVGEAVGLFAVAYWHKRRTV